MSGRDITRPPARHIAGRPEAVPARLHARRARPSSPRQSLDLDLAGGVDKPPIALFANATAPPFALERAEGPERRLLAADLCRSGNLGGVAGPARSQRLVLSDPEHGARRDGRQSQNRKRALQHGRPFLSEVKPRRGLLAPTIARPR